MDASRINFRSSMDAVYGEATLTQTQISNVQVSHKRTMTTNKLFKFTPLNPSYISPNHPPATSTRTGINTLSDQKKPYLLLCLWIHVLRYTRKRYESKKRTKHLKQTRQRAGGWDHEMQLKRHNSLLRLQSGMKTKTKTYKNTFFIDKNIQWTLNNHFLKVTVIRFQPQKTGRITQLKCNQEATC